MTNGPRPSNGRSRRSILAAGGAATTAGLAGCLGSLLGSSSGPREIEPEEPSEPREGTPGEFYSLVEENDIEVDSLVLDGDDLVLEYHSEATDEEESLEEIGTITTVYHENLVANDTDVEMLIAEIVDPFDGQAWGWGAETEWFELNDEGELNDMSLWNSIINSRVYEADVRDDVEHEEPDFDFDDDESTDGNESDGNVSDDGDESTSDGDGGD